MSHRSGRRRRRSALYIIVGILVLMTPVVTTTWKNIEQHRISEEYSRSVSQLDRAEQQAELDEAHRYNDELSIQGTDDPWGVQPDEDSPEYQRYLHTLDAGEVMARVRVPEVGIDSPVYHGLSESTLASGVGHAYGSHLPVGGPGTHAVLAGHTGLATVTLFDNLNHVRPGHIIIVEVMGEKLAYRVDKVIVVLPTELDEVRPEAGHDRLTLVTCTPYGINSHRLLVRGERTELPPGELTQEYHSPFQWWMVISVIASALGLLCLLWWLLSRRRRDKKQDEKTDDREEVPV